MANTGAIKKSPATVTRAREMWNDGADLNAVAATLGITRQSAGDWLKTTGVTAAELYGRGRLGRHPQPPVPDNRPAPDTRSMDERLTGCPLPGRSALDKREHRA